MSEQTQKTLKDIRRCLFEADCAVHEHDWDEALNELKAAQMLIGHLRGLERGENEDGET